MRLLPWRNPLVVTSFMLRARRGGFFTRTTVYLGLLAMAYLGWLYYDSIYVSQKRLMNPHKVFFLFLYGAQCIFSGIVVLGQVGSALKNEVLNKTLDFQRIAAVSPWDILIGKLFGQATSAFLLAIAALPVAVFCLLNGVPGVGPLELLLMWVQMLTFLFLLGAFAIQNTLQITTPKGSGASALGVLAGIMVSMLTMITITLSVNAGIATMVHDPRQMTFPALLTPIPAFAGAYLEAPWEVGFSWFSFQFPCLLFTPLAHVALGWLVLNVMSRRLIRLENTPLGKRLGYVFLVVADLLAVGVMASMSVGGPALGAAGMTLEQQLSLFLIVHTILTIVFLVAVTPRKELIWAWVWRYRGRQPALADAALGDSSPSLVPLLVSLACGAAGAGALLLLGSAAGQGVDPDFLREMSATFIPTILFFGVLYQAYLLTAGKYGGSMFLLTAFVLVAVPTMVGGTLCSTQQVEYMIPGKALLHASPLTPLLKWARGAAPGSNDFVSGVTPYWMAAAYLVLAMTILVLQRKRLGAMIVKVGATKQAMGVHG